MSETVTVIGETITVEVGTQGPCGPAGQGLPTGGSTGEVLKKASNTNYDYEWGTISTATAIVTDSEPLVGSQGELWFDDSTEVLRVYANDSWREQTMDDGFY